MIFRLSVWISPRPSVACGQEEFKPCLFLTSQNHCYIAANLHFTHGKPNHFKHVYGRSLWVYWYSKAFSFCLGPAEALHMHFDKSSGKEQWNDKGKKQTQFISNLSFFFFLVVESLLSVDPFVQFYFPTKLMVCTHISIPFTSGKQPWEQVGVQSFTVEKPKNSSLPEIFTKKFKKKYVLWCTFAMWLFFNNWENI